MPHIKGQTNPHRFICDFSLFIEIFLVVTSPLTASRSPLNMGLTFQTPRHPREVNCPKESSRKNKGMPQNTSMMKYGNMKAPVIHKCLQLHNHLSWHINLLAKDRHVGVLIYINSRKQKWFKNGTKKSNDLFSIIVFPNAYAHKWVTPDATQQI